MSARVEIQPADIRKGDLIRAERTEDVREGRVLRYEDNDIRFQYGRDWYVPGSTLYLLDRPAPAVELPSTPTLGWATHANDGQLFGLFSQNPSTRQIVDCVTCDWGRFSWEPTYVTAFTEAVAVPKSALDALRAAAGNMFPDGPTRNFLAAVDNASTR